MSNERLLTDAEINALDVPEDGKQTFYAIDPLIVAQAQDAKTAAAMQVDWKCACGSIGSPNMKFCHQCGEAKP